MFSFLFPTFLFPSIFIFIFLYTGRNPDLLASQRHLFWEAFSFSQGQKRRLQPKGRSSSWGEKQGLLERRRKKKQPQEETLRPRTARGPRSSPTGPATGRPVSGAAAGHSGESRFSGGSAEPSLGLRPGRVCPRAATRPPGSAGQRAFQERSRQPGRSFRAAPFAPSAERLPPTETPREGLPASGGSPLPAPSAAALSGAFLAPFQTPRGGSAKGRAPPPQAAHAQAGRFPACRAGGGSGGLAVT